jgi:hypothetical protein
MRAIAPSVPPHACPRQGLQRPTPRFYAAGANCSNMCQWWSAPAVQTCVSGGAPSKMLLSTTRTRRRYIAARANLPLTDKAGYTYSARCKTDEFSFPASAAPRHWHSRTATSTWPKQIFRDRTRSHPACFVRCPKLERSKKQLNFPFGKHAHAPPPRQVRTTHGVLRPRARRDRRFARVAARLALSSGKTRGQN